MNEQNNLENNEKIDEAENSNDSSAENTENINNAEQVSETETKEKKEKSFFDDCMEIIESVIISIFFVLLIFTFVARPVTVEGKSMFPTLKNEDRLIMNMIFYTPKQGDIVVIDNHVSYTYEPGTTNIVEGDSLEKRIIKRVIAVGGQTLDIDFMSGTVTVDGEVLEEDYIAEYTTKDLHAFEYPITIPEGYIFVMGDNRNNSTDSRDNHVGFVKEEDVLGEAVFRFYPFDNIKLLD